MKTGILSQCPQNYAESEGSSTGSKYQPLMDDYVTLLKKMKPMIERHKLMKHRMKVLKNEVGFLRRRRRYLQIQERVSGLGLKRKQFTQLHRPENEIGTKSKKQRVKKPGLPPLPPSSKSKKKTNMPRVEQEITAHLPDLNLSEMTSMEDEAFAHPEPPSGINGTPSLLGIPNTKPFFVIHGAPDAKPFSGLDGKTNRRLPAFDLNLPWTDEEEKEEVVTSNDEGIVMEGSNPTAMEWNNKFKSGFG